MSARRKPTVEPADALEAMLTRLQLTAIRDQLDTLLDQAARSELTLREALAMLCQAEVARKDERRIQMGLSIAKFPFVRTLEGFDHEAQPSVDPKQLRELAISRWIASRLTAEGELGLSTHKSQSSFETASPEPDGRHRLMRPPILLLHSLRPSLQLVAPSIKVGWLTTITLSGRVASRDDATGRGCRFRIVFLGC